MKIFRVILNYHYVNRRWSVHYLVFFKSRQTNYISGFRSAKSMASSLYPMVLLIYTIVLVFFAKDTSCWLIFKSSHVSSFFSFTSFSIFKNWSIICGWWRKHLSLISTPSLSVFTGFYCREWGLHCLLNLCTASRSALSEIPAINYFLWYHQ